MIATGATKPKTRSPTTDGPIGIFLTPDGRLPGFAQRRLEDLIARKRTDGLTRKEERELIEALDYIDAKTIQILEHALSQRPTRRGRSKSASGRRNSAAPGKTRNRLNGRR